MPQVPYDLPTQSPSVADLPAAQGPATVPMKDFSGAQMQEMGQAVQSAGVAAMRIAQRFQNEADDSAARSLYSKFSGSVDRIELDYGARRGKDAIDQTIGTMKSVDAAFDETMKGAENDTQRGLFSRMAEVRRQQAGRGITSHSIREKSTYDQESVVAQIGAFQDTAVLYGETYKQPDSPHNTNIAASLKLARELGRLKGFGELDPQQQALNLNVTDPIHASVLTKMIDSHRTTEARDYLGIYREQISAKTALHVEKALQIGTDIQQGQDGAAAAVAEAVGNYSKAIENVRNDKNISAVAKENIVAGIKTLKTEHDVGVQSGYNNAKTEALRTYNQSGLNAISPSILAAMDPVDLHALNATARSDSAAAQKGQAPVTDWAVYHDLSAMQRERPDEFNKLNLLHYYPSLAPEERKHFELAQTGKAPLFTATAQIDAAVKRENLTSSVAGKLTYDAQKAINEATTANHGKPLTVDETRKVIDRVLQSFDYPAEQKRADLVKDKGQPIDAQIRGIGKEANLSKQDQALFLNVAHREIVAEQQKRGQLLSPLQRESFVRSLLDDGELVGKPGAWVQRDTQHFKVIGTDDEKYFKPSAPPRPPAFDAQRASKAFRNAYGRNPTRNELDGMEAALLKQHSTDKEPD